MAELTKEFPTAQFTLRKSSGGVFDVTVDGALVFSKRALGRHAAPGEVLQLVRKVVERT